MRKKLTIIFLFILLSATSAQAADWGDVVFSELMWMGDFKGTRHEWVELYNTTRRPIDLKGWQITRLKDGAEELMLTIPSGIIPANGYFLISNNSAEKISLAVEPDLIDKSISLLNNKLQIKLYDGQWDDGGKLIDVADDGIGKPAAGDNKEKRSMVRVIPPKDGTLADSWHTATLREGWDEDAKEYGTPCNSRMSINLQVRPYNKIPALWSKIKTSR